MGLVVCVRDGDGDAPVVGDLMPICSSPAADFVECFFGSAGLLGAPLGSADRSGCFDEGLEGCFEFLHVDRCQVDLIGGAVDGKCDCAAGVSVGNGCAVNVVCDVFDEFSSHAPILR